MPEPRDPLLKVVHWPLRPKAHSDSHSEGFAHGGGSQCREGTRDASAYETLGELGNDPSAGSPTETLLRLLLPLNDRVWTTFRPWAVVADHPGPVRRPH